MRTLPYAGRLLRVGAATLIAVVFAAVAWTPAPAATTDHLVSPDSVEQLSVLAAGQPDQFAGVYVDRAAHALHVRVVSGTDGARQVQAAVATAPIGDWTVLVEPAKYSKGELDRTMAAVTTAQPWASLSRSSLSVWYVDPRTNRVIVGLTTVTAQLTAQAQATFGDQVTIQSSPRFHSMQSFTKVDHAPPMKQLTTAAKAGGTPAGGVTPDAAPTRLLDAVPYWGGDRIVTLETVNDETFVVQCTAAFEFTLASSLAMSTAGHCGPTGTSWMQGYFDGTNINFTGSIGTDSSTQFGNGLTDAEMLTGSSWAPHVYNSSTVSIPVAGRLPVRVEDGVCTDGSVSSLTCIGVVNAVNTCVTVHDDLQNIDVNECHMDIATAVGGSAPLSQPGDSGGPVFAQINGHAYAEGIISAGTSDHETVVFSDMNFVASVFSGTPSVAP